MIDIEQQANEYAREITKFFTNYNGKVIYNAYIDGFNEAITDNIIDDIIDLYVDYKAGVENEEIDEYEVSSLEYIKSRLKGKRKKV